MSHTLYIDYTESDRITPEDDDGYGDRHTTFRVDGASLDEPNEWQHRKVEVDWDPTALGQAIVLVRRYDDGDTFSSHYGCWEIEGVYPTIATAREAREGREKDDEKGYNQGSTYETYPCVVFK